MGAFKELQNLFRENRKRSWKARTKYFCTALVVGLLPTLFDIGTDGLSVFSFLHGTTYIKNVPDLNHSSVNCSTGDEHCVWCENIGRHLKISANTTEVVYEEFECFEKDPIWGYMTLVFMFLPGLLCISVTWQEKSSGFKAFGLLFLPLFPVFAVIVKILEMFNPGPSWTLLAQLLSTAEAKTEAQFQFMLQLFIIFTRADRQPSTLQIVTMLTSLLTFCKVDIDFLRLQRFIKKKDGHDMGAKKTALLLVQLYAKYTCLTLAYAALIALLRYWMLLAYPIMAGAAIAVALSIISHS